jgi:hypothetical protein
MILGLIMGLMAENINDIWDWIIMGLTAGLLAPGLLRLYWWRFNGWGVAGGLVLGGAGALFQRAVSQFFPADQVATVLEAGDPVSWLNHTLYFVATMGPIRKFVMMLTLSFLGAVPVALLTKPTADKILVNFYRRTRCFGLWSQPRKFLDDDFLAYVDRENRNDLIAIPVVLVWQILLFLIPMQIIIHSWSALAVTLPIWLASCVGVYYLWYRKLPEDVLEPEDVPVQDGLAEDTAAPPQS